jgi:tetraacyldisaccharide 4'-kinase
MSILPDAESFRRLANGSLTGPAPAALRGMLAALALPYGVATATRNRLYDRRILPILAAPLPVISVGNLTLGGTGKTPLVAWICQRLLAHGARPAVVSRGYGARRGETSDEAAELAILLPGVPHVANRDRVAAAATAARLGADVVVLDDGFQHRRLHRDLDIVAVDASDPFGCGHLVPRGMLRESAGGLARADAVVLTRATGVAAADRAGIRAAVTAARRGREVAWLETEHRPASVRSLDGAAEPLSSLAGRRVAAFCGIGNPAAFRRTLIEAGVELAAFRSFADHHDYGPGDLQGLARWADESAAEQLLTTMKDLVKIRSWQLGSRPLAAVEVSLEPLASADDLERLIVRTLRPGGAAA